MTQHIAALADVEFDDRTSQSNLLYKVDQELKLERIV